MESYTLQSTTGYEEPFVTSDARFASYNATCTDDDEDCGKNQWCLDHRCQCWPGYKYHPDIGCMNDSMDAMVQWVFRVCVTALVCFACVLSLYLVFNRRARLSRGGSQESLLGGDRHAWSDAPPPYVEVVAPPPSYTEALLAALSQNVSVGEDAVSPAPHPALSPATTPTAQCGGKEKSSRRQDITLHI